MNSEIKLEYKMIAATFAAAILFTVVINEALNIAIKLFIH